MSLLASLRKAKMPFYLYNKQGEILELEKPVSLAGYNVIYNLWNKKNKPLDQGWHINLDEIIEEITKGKGNKNTHSLIIHLQPYSKEEINLLEILDIWAYSYSYKGEVSWTPLMFRLKDVFYYEEDILTKEKIQRLIKQFSPNSKNREDIFEFLYLQGNERGWNWGGLGQLMQHCFINQLGNI